MLDEPGHEHVVPESATDTSRLEEPGYQKDGHEHDTKDSNVQHKVHNVFHSNLG